MVYELKDGDNLVELLEKIKEKNKNRESKRKKKTLADIYGKLIRGIDGLEYQKEARGE